MSFKPLPLPVKCPQHNLSVQLYFRVIGIIGGSALYNLNDFIISRAAEDHLYGAECIEEPEDLE
jgi:hypothetical protein